MKKYFITVFFALAGILVSSQAINAQVVNDGRANAEIVDNMSNYVKDTDWILLGKAKAYKDVKNTASGNLYVRVVGRKFFYKIEINGEEYVVNKLMAKNTKNLEFQQILDYCNAVVYRDSPFYLAVPVW